MCSTTRIVGSFGLSSDRLLLARHQSRVSFIVNSNRSYLKTSTSKYGCNLLLNSGLLPLKIRAEHQHTTNDKNKMDVKANGGTGTPGPSHDGWKSWILGTLLTILLPFWKYPWGPLLKIKRNVETFVGVIDAGTEVLEKVADGIVKVADEVAEHLPEGSPLRETVCNVYHVAQNVADSAHKADEIIHKIEKLEEEAEERLEKIREEGEEKSVEAKKEGEDEEEVKDVEKVKNENQENIVEEESKIVREPGAVVNQGITMTTATTTEVIEQKEQQQSDK